MDSPVYNGISDPEPQAPWWSKLTFSWTLPLLRKGQKRRLERDDLYQLPDQIHTANVTDRLERAWTREKLKKLQGKEPGYRTALARAFGADYCRCIPLVLTEDLVCLAQPVLFRYLMGYYADPREISTGVACLLALCLALTNITLAVVGPQIVFRYVKFGMTWQSATCGMVYKKMARLSHKARMSVKSGHILDLVSTDSGKLDWLLWYLNTPWQAPLRIVIVTTIVYQTLGVAVFAAMALFCVLIPLQSYFAKRVAHYRKQQLGSMDSRIDVISELVAAMRLVKMYCWEVPFTKRVNDVRDQEMQSIWRSRLWNSLLLELTICNRRLTIAVMVLVYVAQDGVLMAATIFPAYDLFSQLSYLLSEQIPVGIKTWLDVGVCTNRIEKFLLLDEIDEKSDLNDDDGRIEMSNVNATWSIDAPRLTLDDVSLSVDEGKLLMIHGEVGAGKTSLLKALMGEFPLTSGIVRCSSSLAYVPQSPWIFSSTLKQNILFGLEFDSERYYRVLKACALDQDIIDLPYGDSTLVGEKGVTLSGGQKTRVCLARALYTDAHVYLLDDPLSSVDTTVGNVIMQRAIKDMLRDKTVVLVTHQLQYLREADVIISMKQGKIEQVGDYTDLIDLGTELTDVEKKSEELSTPMVVDKAEDKSHLKELYLREIEEREEEHREYGHVGWTVYLAYIRAGGRCWLQVTMLAMFVVTQLMSNCSDWWLAKWSHADEQKAADVSINHTLQHTVSTHQHDSSTSTHYYASVYISLILLSLVIGLCRTILYNYVTVLASKNLHRQIFHRLMRAPIRFFDTTPKGRIVNRFSGDMGTVDDALPEILYNALVLCIQIAGNMLLTVILNWHLFFAIFPCTVLLYVIRMKYLNAQRHLARLNRAANSPFLGHLSGSIDGVEVIRAFSAQDRCTQDFGLHQDSAIGCWYTHLSAFVWFQFNCNITGSLLNILIVFICLLGADSLTPATIGLVFTLTIPMISWFQDGIKFTAEIEIEMTSTERVLEYRKLEQERCLETLPNNQPDDSWPHEGAVSFRNVSFCYRDDKQVLHDVSFDVMAGEKIGVVGRTGAGKSSLVQALFRMAEPIGQICIDDVETDTLGLHDVRGCISVIPQDPVLFSGTIRSNLDPFLQHSDVLLWQSLEEVKMKEATEKLTGQLDCTVSDAGSNFSAGERQLLCLARALLSHKRILVLDEATANVDKRTDEVIQETIASKFSRCTVITIAHRLNTVMNNDKILVLDRGALVEYDEPNVLLSRRGMLYDMVQQTGKQESERLTTIARQTLKRKLLVSECNT